MQQQISDLSQKVASLTTLQATQHAQNRSDIHALRNGQQSVLDALTMGLDKIGEKIDQRIRPLERQMDRATGYAIGIAALASLVFKIGEAIFNHVAK